VKRTLQRISRTGNQLTSAYLTVIIISVGVFLIGFTITSLFARAVSEQNRIDYTAELTQESASLRTGINERSSSYNQLLFAAAAQFGVKSEITRQDWRRFYEAMRVEKNYPSIVGLGYAPFINNDSIPVFETAIQDEGFSDFHVKGVGSDSDHAIIQYIEPFDGINMNAFGFDMYSDKSRRDAMMSARDSGSAVLSRPVQLMQDANPNASYGSLLYLPVYNTITPPSSVDERRAQLRGFVYVAFRPSDIVARASEDIPGLNDDVNVSLRSLSSGTGQTLYEVNYAASAAKNLTTVVKDISVYGQTWRLTVAGQDRAISQFYGPISLFFLGAGVSSFVALTVYFILALRLGKVERLFMQDVENTKSDLLALASHQLRTPATGVKQYLGILREGIMGPLTPSQQEMIEKAYDTNERQLHVINDLLYVSKVEAGQLSIDPVITDVTKITKDAISSLEPRAKEKDIDVIFNAKKAVHITADDRYVGMIIENLISNAIKYSYPSSKVRVTLKLSNAAMVLKVADRGVGIDQADIEKAFDKFNRIDNPLSRQEGGSGLGLFLASQLAKGHGGSISVEKKKGKGTTFVLTLPSVAMIDQDIVNLADARKRGKRLLGR
jgi:signal transduction histidine kinase